MYKNQPVITKLQAYVIEYPKINPTSWKRNPIRVHCIEIPDQASIYDTLVMGWVLILPHTVCQGTTTTTFI